MPEVTPEESGLVLWHVTERQTVLLLKDDADWIFRVSEAFDGIPFAWPVTFGWIFVLMPRRMGRADA